MIRKRILSALMCFMFLSLTLISTSNTYTASAFAPQTTTASVPVVVFSVKPLAEYMAGSNITFKVFTKTALSTTKVEYSVKLFNLDTQKKEMDIGNYGNGVLASEAEAYTFVVKNPGNYRLAVYVREFGTPGKISNYYDNYITNDFKVVKLDKITKTLKSVDPITVNVYQKTPYTLPTTINGRMSDNSLKQYKVTWDKVVNTNNVGIYTFKGTLKEAANSAVVNNISAKLTLNVNPLPVFDTINVSVDALSDYVLPATVDSKSVNGKSNKFIVAWDKQANTTTPGAYTFMGAVKETTASAIIKNVNVKLSLKVNPLPTYDSIVASVDQGSTFVLPATVNGKLFNGTVKQYGVTWDKPASTTTPGAFTFKGAVKDLTTSKILPNVAVILTLNVKAIPTVDPITVNIGEGNAYELPSTVGGKLWDGSTVVYNVTWDKKADTSKTGTYNFIGTLKDVNTSAELTNVTAKLTLTVNPVPLQVVSITPINTKAIKIVFNKSVDYGKCTIPVSMNGISVPVTTAWASDGKSVLLQSQNDYAVGAYVVKIDGAGLATDTYAAEIKDPTLTNVSIATAVVTPNNDAAKVFVKGTDQYGQGINLQTSDFEWSVSDDTAKILLTVIPSSDDYITIQTNVPSVKIGDKITVTGKYKYNYTISTSSNLVVNSKQIDSITMNQPVLPSGDKRLSVKNTSMYYEIPYDAVQNFNINGVSSKASAVLEDKVETSLLQDVTINNITFITDRPDILTSIKVENGKLYVKIAGNKSGTVKLMATLLSTSGQVSLPYTLTLNIAGPSIPNSISFGNPDSVLVVGGAPCKIPVAVSDQYGEVISPDDFALTNFNDFIISSSNPSVATAAFGNDGKTLNIIPITVGTSDIKITNRNSGIVKIYTVSVNAASIVKDFISTTDYTALVKGASANLRITTLDQYGNKLQNAASTYKYSVTANNGTSNVKISSTNVTVNAVTSSAITITGVTPGKTETITVTLYNDTNNNNTVEASEIIKAYAFNMSVVADSEQLNYKVNPVNTIYAAVAQDKNNAGPNGDAYGAIQNQNNKNSNYGQKITLSAARLDGTPVALAANPITAVAVTINPSIIDNVYKIGNDYYAIGRQWSDNDLTKDANLLISYKDNTGAINNVNTKITVSKESLKATTLRFMINNGKDIDTTSDSELQGAVYNISAADINGLNGKKLIENQALSGIPCYFEVDDQYGVSSINPVSFSIVSKQSTSGNFNFDANGIITSSNFAAGDSVTISALDTEGHTLTITLKVQ